MAEKDEDRVARKKTKAANPTGAEKPTPKNRWRRFQKPIRRVWHTKDDPHCAPGMTFHGLRHSAITRLRSSGMRPKVIALLTGHTSDEIVHSYDPASDVELYGGLESVHALKVSKGS